MRGGRGHGSARLLGQAFYDGRGTRSWAFGVRGARLLAARESEIIGNKRAAGRSTNAGFRLRQDAGDPLADVPRFELICRPGNEAPVVELDGLPLPERLPGHLQAASLGVQVDESAGDVLAGADPQLQRRIWPPLPLAIMA
jgi:hypothetical protein